MPIIIIGIGLELFGEAATFFTKYLVYISTHVMLKRPVSITIPEFWWGYIILFISLVVIGPIFEEFAFRGLIMSSLESSYGIVKAIALSSVIFSFAHLEPARSIAIFLQFLIVGWLVYKTNSIFSSIMVHAINNFWCYITLVLFKEYFSKPPAIFGPFWTFDQRAIFLMLSCLIITIGIVWLKRIHVNEPSTPLTFAGNYFRPKANQIAITPITSESKLGE
jgi:membrane protease YdiL (CAAX protease family)